MSTTKKKAVRHKKPKPRTTFTEEDIEKFVVLWRDADNPSQVADAMGCSLSIAYSLATRLRSKGVALKKFHRQSDIDADRLNKLLKTTK